MIDMDSNIFYVINKSENFLRNFLQNIENFTKSLNRHYLFLYSY